MITIYTRPHCQFCFAAKRLLTLRGLEYTEINIDVEPGAAAEMIQRTGNPTVPQVCINEMPIGGFSELTELDRAGELMSLSLRKI